MSELLTSEEMMLVGGGCSRSNSKSNKTCHGSRNKTRRHREKRCSER